MVILIKLITAVAICFSSRCEGLRAGSMEATRSSIRGPINCPYETTRIPRWDKERWSVFIIDKRMQQCVVISFHNHVKSHPCFQVSKVNCGIAIRTTYVSFVGLGAVGFSLNCWMFSCYFEHCYIFRKCTWYKVVTKVTKRSNLNRKQISLELNWC